jgi:hypothetical protein
MRFLDSDHQSLPSLQPLEQNMLRESYERAGSIARSLGAPRAANPYAASAQRGPGAYAADKERLQLLAEHWWRGWDKAASGGSRSTAPQATGKRRKRSPGAA